MAKTCKYRSAFFMDRKCRTCKNRKRCLAKVNRNRNYVRVIVNGSKVIVPMIVCVALVCTLCKIFLNVNQAEAIETESNTTEQYNNYQNDESNHDESSDVTEEPIDTEQPISEGTRGVFTESEKIAMGKTVYKEARGECEEGRVAVVAVILNRLETGRQEYGAENGNIMEVITYPGAFAYPKDMTDEFFLNCPEYDLCMEAVERAINGEDPTRSHFPDGARHFYSVTEPLSQQEAAKRNGIDKLVIGNQAFHNDFN